MIKRENTTLICTPMIYCANNDENNFFMWLANIPNTEIIGGSGEELYVKIYNTLSRKDTQEILGFFLRYDLQKDHLKVLINENNKDLIEDYCSEKLLIDRSNTLTLILGNSKGIIECMPLFFYTDNDKYYFLEWLKKIPCVMNMHEIKKELYAQITERISRKETWEMLGFFCRYQLEPKGLTILVNARNKKIIHDYTTKKIFH